MKKSGVNLLFLLIIISISLATSIRYPRHSSKSYSEICDDREKQWQKEEELRVKKLREGMSEKLNNMYGDGLWKEDFSEEKKILDEALKKSFTENCNVSEEIKNIFSIDMIYYNSCLKELNEGRLTIDEFIKYPYKYTYSGTVNCYVYEIIEKSQDDRSNYDTFISNFKNLKMMNDKIDYCIYYLSNLEEISLNYKKWNSLSNIDNVYENIKNQQEDIVAIKKRLNELYNEQFLYSQKDYGYYSINRPDVIFDVYITDEDKVLHTKYLTVLTQKYFTEIINEIIKEEGGGSAVIPYVRPLLRSYEDNDVYVDNVSYDTSNIESYDDKIKLINDGYMGDYDVYLYYIKNTNETFDYDMILDIEKRISDLIISPGYRDMMEDHRYKSRVYFYNGSDSDKVTLSYLFDKDNTSESSFTWDNPVDPMSDRWIDPLHKRAGNKWRGLNLTDGFDYLDIFCDKDPYEMYIREKLTEKIIEDIKFEKMLYDIDVRNSKIDDGR